MNRPVRKHEERGSALVAVLALIFTASILTASVLMLSKTVSFDMHAHVELQRSRYINEGAATRIQWLIAADSTANNSTRTMMGDSSVYDDLDEDEDRYLPDGVEHTLDYYGHKLKFTITDGASGFNLVNGYSQLLTSMSSFWQEDDPDKSEELLALRDKITDYISSDSGGTSSETEDGFTAEDYENAGMLPLPRQSFPVYREELLWIPTFAKLFPPDKYGRLSSVMMPEAVSGGNNNPSFFTATKEMIRMFCNLEEEDADELIAAREEWFKKRVSISENADELLLASAQSRLSWMPSGIYTVFLESAEDPRKPSHRLIFTFDGFPASGPQNNLVTFLEWLMF